MNPPVPPGESARTITRNARIGLVLFVFYCLIYGGYVALCAFAPGVMADRLWGINLAVIYGLGLIHAAVALAIVYILLCARDADREAPGIAGTDDAPTPAASEGDNA